MVWQMSEKFDFNMPGEVRHMTQDVVPFRAIANVSPTNFPCNVGHRLCDEVHSFDANE